MLSQARHSVAAAAIFVLAAVSVVGESEVPLPALVGKTLTGQVVAVVDGDTFDVRLFSDRVVRVRLEGVDAPALGAPFGNDARNIARNVLFERIVVLYPSGVDREVVLVARVVVDGRDASCDFVRRGMACVEARHLADPTLVEAQRQARVLRAGFWRFSHSRPAVCPQPLDVAGLPDAVQDDWSVLEG